MAERSSPSSSLLRKAFLFGNGLLEVVLDDAFSFG